MTRSHIIPQSSHKSKNHDQNDNYSGHRSRRPIRKNELPSDKWFKNHGGVVAHIDFRTKAEYDAYVQALFDNRGWNDYKIIKHEQTPQDCPFCRQWCEYFADKKTTVYCPDCRQPILNI